MSYSILLKINSKQIYGQPFFFMHVDGIEYAKLAYKSQNHIKQFDGKLK